MVMLNFTGFIFKFHQLENQCKDVLLASLVLLGLVATLVEIQNYQNLAHTLNLTHTQHFFHTTTPEFKS